MASVPRCRRGSGRPTRLLRLECLEQRKLMAVMDLPMADPLEQMPTSPFIVSPFIDPLVIPTALAPGWREPDGTLAPDDPAAWSVRETQLCRRHAHGRSRSARSSVPPARASISRTASALSRPSPASTSSTTANTRSGPMRTGRTPTAWWERRVGRIPIRSSITSGLQVAEHDFTSSRVMPITAARHAGAGGPTSGRHDPGWQRHRRTALQHHLRFQRDLPRIR